MTTPTPGARALWKATYGDHRPNAVAGEALLLDAAAEIERLRGEVTGLRGEVRRLVGELKGSGR